MRSSKIRCGRNMLMRMCEMLRASGKKEPTVCDIAILLDCDVKDVIREHERLDKHEVTQMLIPIMLTGGVLGMQEWHRADHPECYEEKK